MHAADSVSLDALVSTSSAPFRVYRSRPCVPLSLFQPVISTSRSPFLECDYNLHKSNSTYFSDLDIARSHLFCCLLAKFIDTLRTPSKQEQAKGAFNLNLGAVTCQFKKPIKLYQPYEMWTRVLSWDDKWLYLVTHFVESGKVKPIGFSLQPWKKVHSRVAGNDSSKPHSAILASSVARYVFKRGRTTIPPERVLTLAGLLPARPVDSPPAKSSSVDLSTEGDTTLRSSPSHASQVDESPTALKSRPEGLIWDWERIESTRVRGMRVAKLIVDLDDAHMEFAGPLNPALGQF